MSNYITSDWRLQLVNANKANWKELIYIFIRPFLNLKYRKYLSSDFLLRHKPQLVIGERGFPLLARRRWAMSNINSLADKVILIQGCGNGWDLADWSKYNPKKLIGIDLFEFNSWQEIKFHIEKNFKTNVEFHCRPLDDLSNIGNESIDFCSSDAVFEHIKEFEKFLVETK